MTEFIIPPSDNNVKLLTADIYKEIHLRGYELEGWFKSLVEACSNGLEGKIQWRNWTTFLDCMMQAYVLSKDSKHLSLPTSISEITFDPQLHKKLLKEHDDGIIGYVACPYTKAIQAGGVRTGSFQVTHVNRRRALIDPVFEIYKFVPYRSTTQIYSEIDIAKICLQLMQEKHQNLKLEVVEIDAFDGKAELSGFIVQALEDLPMVKSKVHYLTTRLIELESVIIEDRELTVFEGINIVIKSNCLGDEAFLTSVQTKLLHDGMLISREENDTSLSKFIPNGLQIIATFATGSEIIVVLIPTQRYKQSDIIVKITSNVEDWFEPLKTALQSKSVLVYSQNETSSGILGLVNCLRKEVGEDKLTCVLINDINAPSFDSELDFYKEQFRKNLKINVLENGEWGSYRHLSVVEDVEKKSQTEHIYCSSLNGIKSLNWCRGNMTTEVITNDPNCIKVHYSGLNFRDVMLSTGKIKIQVYSRIEQQTILGMEFSGVRNDGKRVFGISDSGAITNYFKGLSLCWEVPKDWSLEEAVTTPLVYCTVLLAFFVKANVKQGQSILIHSGCGGVGLAAIRIAFHYGLEVYTTVSSDNKIKYLMDEFPQLQPENIGHSRNTSFEALITERTKGNGVDYVLNSLSGDKLVASIRCLATSGTFLELGKIDIINKTAIDLGFLAKDIQIKAVFLRVGATGQFVGQTAAVSFLMIF